MLAEMHETMAGECPACGKPLAAPFCGQCGEKRLDHHALSLGHFLEHAAEAFIHFDGAIVRTLKTLVLAPGRLTADWARGCRKPYLAPVQLFVLMNVLFFAATAYNGWNTLSTTLFVYLNRMDAYQDLARAKVDQKLAAARETGEQYAARFDAASRTQAKSLVILMVPVFALGLAALRAGQGRYFAEHLVFAVHFYAFLLLLLAVQTTLTTWLLRLSSGWSDQAVDMWGSSVTLTVLLAYLTLAMRATGTRSVWRAGAEAAVLVGWFMAVLFGYRFLLFFVTLATT